ncbi:MAG: site-2 protease family protein [Kofleriaceae bacterium]|nr:site-2 protease family protein [Kofleriaceae bacterium]
MRWVLIYVFTLVVSVALHEFGHAFMADKLGDDTPRRQGRVTLNPLAHADPIGTLALPLLGGILGGGGFGWGRPVEWQPARVRRGISMATAKILVAIAGPFMNIVLGTVLAFTHVVLTTKGVISPQSDMNKVLYFASITNFTLFFFNLLPLPPLDGGHVAESFTPYRHRKTFEQWATYAPFIILGVMMIPQVRQVFLIPAGWCTRTVYDAALALF